MNKQERARLKYLPERGQAPVTKEDIDLYFLASLAGVIDPKTLDYSDPDLASMLEDGGYFTEEAA